MIPEILNLVDTNIDYDHSLLRLRRAQPNLPHFDSMLVVLCLFRQLESCVSVPVLTDFEIPGYDMAEYSQRFICEQRTLFEYFSQFAFSNEMAEMIHLYYVIKRAIDADS